MGSHRPGDLSLVSASSRAVTAKSAPSSCPLTAAAAADVQREQGTLAATDLVFGLQLLREHHSAKACFWTCAFCPPSTSRFAVAKAFQQHLQAFHEMVQIGQDGQPLQCSLCRQTVCSLVPTCSLDVAMLWLLLGLMLVMTTGPTGWEGHPCLGGVCGCRGWCS